jgi:hypothetical protein
MKLEFLANGARACPLIRLYEFNRAEAKNLRELVKSLSNASRQSISLEEEPWIESVEGCRLALRLGHRDEGVRESGPSTFECVLNSGGWNNMEGLLDPFCKSDAVGFQWLTTAGKISLLLSRVGTW